MIIVKMSFSEAKQMLLSKGVADPYSVLQALIALGVIKLEK